MELMELLKIDSSIYTLEYTDIPSYLNEVLNDDSNDKVLLIYCKKADISLDETAIPDPSIKLEISINADLTGNPLEVDLNGVSLVNMSLNEIQPNNWTDEENNHYPLELRTATRQLNAISLSRTHAHQEPDIYCMVCNGADSKHTILLAGAPKQRKSFLLHYNGLLKRNDQKMTMEYMKKRHDKGVGKKSNYTSLCTHTYSLEGYKLKKTHNLLSSNISRSAIIKASFNSPSYTLTEGKLIKTELMLQVLPAHDKAVLNSYWNQLDVIQDYIDVFSSDNIEVDISANSKDFHDIKSELLEFLQASNNVPRKPIVKTSIETTPLNYDALREEDFMDKLWNLLGGETSKNIKACMEDLFETLENTRLIRLTISANNKSKIAESLNGVLKGTTEVAPLTTASAIELVIELGLEKLKNDYLFIIKYYDDYDEELTTNIEKNWSAFEETKPKSHRTKTIFSFHKKDASIFQSKLDYLYNLHVACEFLQLAHNVILSTGFIIPCRTITSKYIIAKNTESFKTGKDDKLSEITIDLRDFYAPCLHKFELISWNYRMVTSEKYGDATTIFHHSKHNIIPPTVFNNHDISLDSKEDDLYYVLQYYKS